MKLMNVAVVTMVIVAAAAAFDHENTRVFALHWFGSETSISLSDSTFVAEAKWDALSGEPPPLQTRDAVRIATDYIATNRMDSLEYAPTEIHLERFSLTDYWYYKVALETTDRDWRTKEPYASKLRTGEYKREWGDPRLVVFVLMSGAVLENTAMAGNARLQL